MFCNGYCITINQIKGVYILNRLEGVMMSLEYILSNKRKRHIMGGSLLSASLLFAGLAFTILTLKHDDEKEGETESDEIRDIE